MIFLTEADRNAYFNNRPELSKVKERLNKISNNFSNFSENTFKILCENIKANKKEEDTNPANIFIKRIIDINLYFEYLVVDAIDFSYIFDTFEEQISSYIKLLNTNEFKALLEPSKNKELILKKIQKIGEGLLDKVRNQILKSIFQNFSHSYFTASQSYALLDTIVNVIKKHSTDLEKVVINRYAAAICEIFSISAKHVHSSANFVGNTDYSAEIEATPSGALFQINSKTLKISNVYTGSTGGGVLRDCSMILDFILQYRIDLEGTIYDASELIKNPDILENRCHERTIYFFRQLGDAIKNYKDSKEIDIVRRVPIFRLKTENEYKKVFAIPSNGYMLKMKTISELKTLMDIAAWTGLTKIRIVASNPQNVSSFYSDNFSSGVPRFKSFNFVKEKEPNRYRKFHILDSIFKHAWVPPRDVEKNKKMELTYRKLMREKISGYKRDKAFTYYCLKILWEPVLREIESLFKEVGIPEEIGALNLDNLSPLQKIKIDSALSTVELEKLLSLVKNRLEKRGFTPSVYELDFVKSQLKSIVSFKKEGS